MSDSNAYFPHGNDDADYWPIVVERFQRLRAAAEQIAAAAAALDQVAVIKAAPVVSAETTTTSGPAGSAGDS